MKVKESQQGKGKIVGRTARRQLARVTRPLLVPWLRQRAFVVQFHKETALERWHVAGRIEHGVSGQAAPFRSLEELFAFMTRVLATVRAPPRRRTTKPG